MFYQSVILLNRQALDLGHPVLYSNGSPFLMPNGDQTALFQVTINAQNLFTLVSNPSLASTTTVYRAWFPGEHPSTPASWSVVLGSVVKPCQFIKYSFMAGLYVGYFKHSN